MGDFNVIEVEAGEAGVHAALDAVHALFEDEVSVALVPAGDAAALAAVDAEAPLHTDEPTLVLTTSGSLGQPRGVELTVTAVAMAAEMSAVHFRGQAVWLTALPVTGIGGLNTVVRSALAGTAPVIWDGVAGAASFEADEFIPYLDAVVTAARKQELAAAVSLVPTQLHRLAQSPAALAHLAQLDYVLVGGGAAAPALIDMVRGHGVRLTRTYGATETCGGIVYDGQPLPGVGVTTDESGQVMLSGPSNATCYRDGTVIGSPWATGDLGLIEHGTLHITGRNDDVVKVAGHKLNLRAVATALQSLRDVAEIEIVAFPDDEYGMRPAIAYAGAATSDEVKAAFQSAHGGTVLPVTVLQVRALPMLANGKPDRAAIIALCQTRPL